MTTTDGTTPTSSSTSCEPSPPMTVGPYFVEAAPHRSDVREEYPNSAQAANGSWVEDPDEEFIDEMPTRGELPLDDQGVKQEGMELRLTFTILKQAIGGDCTPMAGARMDIWHANAYGKYSGFTAEGTAGQDWLRGAQTTDDQGQVTFTTIWPGWYRGRAVHIHLKVREPGLDFTSQFFFDPTMNEAVMKNNAPYNARGVPDTPNGHDKIYGNGGDKMLVLTQSASGYYTGTKTVVVT